MTVSRIVFRAALLGALLALLAARGSGDERILPDPAQNGMGFGAALARYGDWAVVGAPDDHWTFKGSARILLRVDGAWQEQARLLAADGATGDQFGRAVAIDDFVDPRVVVGAPRHLSYAGAAYVFVFEGGAWSLEQKLVASDAAAGDNFGTAVAIFDDLALVGAPGHDGNGSTSGRVYLFHRSGSVWAEVGTLEPDDAAAASRFGSAVALAALGSTAVVGAGLHRHDPYPAPASGSAYVFHRSGDVWTQDVELLPSDGWENMGFGEQLGVSGLGLRVVVGAAGTLSTARAGSAYVYERSGASWGQKARLDSGEGETRLGFGDAVALAANGNSLVVGDPYWRDQDGAVHGFVRDTVTWRRIGRWRASETTLGARFGDAVAMWAPQPLAGAPRDDGAATHAGAVYVADELVFADGFESGGFASWSSTSA